MTRKRKPSGQKQRKVFLRNATLMRKRGTARGRQAMIVAKTADTLMPPVARESDRYRRMAAEECSRALDGAVNVGRRFTRREVVMIRRIMDVIQTISAHA